MKGWNLRKIAVGTLWMDPVKKKIDCNHNYCFLKKEETKFL